MLLPRLPHPLGVVLALAIAAPGARAQPDPGPGAPLSSLGELLDRIPNFSPFDLPGFLPRDMFHLYSTPHFGDLVHRDYMRVPVGVRAKIDPQLEARVEIEGYFTHGFGDAAGYGLDRLRTGIKYEIPNPPLRADAIAWSTGVDFATPLSRPPVELSDGHRHSLPYVAASRVIAPDWRLLGFGSLGADLLAHTALPPNFGRNELHSNSLTMSAGVVRDWPKFRATLTASLATTALLSDEHHQVFGLRPAVVFPLTRWQGRHTRLLLAVGGWTAWGPDGHELGASASLRVEFLFKPRGDKR
jgi:hypothetical protein